MYGNLGIFVSGPQSYTEITNSKNLGSSYYLSSIVEGSGARYVSHTNGSGSGWIRIFKLAWIHIGNQDRDHTTVLYYRIIKYIYKK